VIGVCRSRWLGWTLVAISHVPRLPRGRPVFIQLSSSFPSPSSSSAMDTTSSICSAPRARGIGAASVPTLHE
jgi:hypothetical protein